MPPHHRVNWEFEAVVRGEMGPLLEGQPPECSRDTLWVFSPGCAHGWTGHKHSSCEVIVFHFNTVSPVLKQLMPECGWMAIGLKRKEKLELGRLHRELVPHYWKPRLISEMYADKCLVELTLLCLQRIPRANRAVHSSGDIGTLARAEEWMQRNLHASPTVREAARAAGVSESGLYRLFRELRKKSPQQALLESKLKRATELLANSEGKLELVAQECGFSNASALCRAFKAAMGCSPKAWAREIFIQYKRPPKALTGDYTQHGKRKKQAPA